MNLFHSDVKTHVNLLTQLSKSVKDKFNEIIINAKITKRGTIDGIGS